MFHTTSFSRSGHLPDASRYRYSCSTSFYHSTSLSEGGGRGEDDRLDRLLQDMASLEVGRNMQQQHQHYRQQAFPLPSQTSASKIPRTSTGPKIEIMDDGHEEDHNHQYQCSRSGAYPATRQLQGQPASSHVSAATRTTTTSSSSRNRPRTERRAITYHPLPCPHPTPAPSTVPSASASASAATTRPKKSKSNSAYAPLPPLPYQLAAAPRKFGPEDYHEPASKSSTRTAHPTRRINTDPDPDLIISPSDSISQISVSGHSSSKNKNSSSSNGTSTGRGGGGGGGTTVYYTYIPREERRGRTRRRGQRWSESVWTVDREREGGDGEGRGGGGMSAYSGDHGPVAGGYSQSSATMMQMPKGKFETRIVTPLD